jgi:hypothetical protein
MIAWGVGDVARTLNIPKENVHLKSPYLGGGFGGKLFVRSDAIMAALGAREAKRPVKVTLARPMVFNNTTPEKPVLINGDDIAFRATSEEVDRWEFFCQLGGFVVNRQKTHISCRYVEINSQPL